MGGPKNETFHIRGGCFFGKQELLNLFRKIELTENWNDATGPAEG